MWRGVENVHDKHIIFLALMNKYNIYVNDKNMYTISHVFIVIAVPVISGSAYCVAPSASPSGPPVNNMS